MSNVNNKLADLQKKLSSMFGVAVEITIRDLKAFTISFDGENETIAKRISSYLASATQKVEVLYDKDCEATFIYFTA